MIVIGLTGNIACGKSTVAKMLEQLGAELIDADRVVHTEMAPGQPVWRAVVSEFGEELLNEDRTINRAKLAAVVFNDATALKRLETITHPAAHKAMKDKVDQSASEVVVVEAVKLVEAGWLSEVDSLWVVTCSEEGQLARMMRDRGMSEQDSMARLAAQPEIAPKLRIADVVIDNSGSREDTLAQVKRALAATRGKGGKQN